jgi:hypothetical protein
MPNMRRDVLVLALAFAFSCYGCGKLNAGTRAAAISSASAAEKPAPANTSAKVDFSTQIKPILEARCQPCHFTGGKVYAKMPFDRPETIKTLGTKLFTRLKDENERRLISNFLAQE